MFIQYYDIYLLNDLNCISKFDLIYERKVLNLI